MSKKNQSSIGQLFVKKMIAQYENSEKLNKINQQIGLLIEELRQNRQYSNCLELIGACYCTECQFKNTDSCPGSFYAEDDGHYYTPESINFCSYGIPKK